MRFRSGQQNRFTTVDRCSLKRMSHFLEDYYLVCSTQMVRTFYEKDARKYIYNNTRPQKRHLFSFHSNLPRTRRQSFIPAITVSHIYRLISGIRIDNNLSFSTLVGAENPRLTTNYQLSAISVSYFADSSQCLITATLDAASSVLWILLHREIQDQDHIVLLSTVTV